MEICITTLFEFGTVIDIGGLVDSSSPVPATFCRLEMDENNTYYIFKDKKNIEYKTVLQSSLAYIPPKQKKCEFYLIEGGKYKPKLKEETEEETEEEKKEGAN